MASMIGHNAPKKEEIARFFKDIDAADDELRSLQSAYMNRCKRPRKRIREALAGAKVAGFDMAALRALMAERRDRRRIDKRIERLEPDEAESLAGMRAALGDFAMTDLGKAALERAKKGAATLDDLAPTSA